MKQEINEFIEKNKNRFIEELIDFLKIPSISSDDKYADDILKAASFVKYHLLKAGADYAEIEATEKHPIVYAEKTVNKNFPTVLIYGHYDVQPSDPIELWDSPPFNPIIKEGKVYARGACDDKGQMFMQLKALEFLSKTEKLNCNLKFIFEGEEEIGSPSLENYIISNKEKLKADIVLVSDTAMIDNETPSIINGLKGIAYFEIEVEGPNRDVHSGIHGGTIANPINVLCEMISKLKDRNNTITIPGFYDDIILPTQKEQDAVNKIPFDPETYKNDLGVKDIDGEFGYNTLQRIAFRPTLDINGIWGGYNGKGAKTIIPSKAFTKLSMRLVPGQSSIKITELFESYIKALAPQSVKVKLTLLASSESALTTVDSIAYRAAEMAIQETFGKLPVPQRMGGSIPVISMFEMILNANSILMGFGLNSDNIHSPNEHFGIFNYLKGIETIPIFINKYGMLKECEKIVCDSMQLNTNSLLVI